MSLLDHSNIKKNKKKSLQRGARIEVKDKVDRSLLSKEETGKVEESFRLTIPTNIRVDNHIRNSISALITLGHADSQREMAEILVNQYIETLDDEEYKRYIGLVDIYLDKDIQKQQQKKVERDQT